MPRRLTAALLLAALALLVLLCVLLALGRLLAALGDAAGATLLERTALLAGVLLISDLICLVLLQSARDHFPPDHE